MIYFPVKSKSNPDADPKALALARELQAEATADAEVEDAEDEESTSTSSTITNINTKSSTATASAKPSVIFVDYTVRLATDEQAEAVAQALQPLRADSDSDMLGKTEGAGPDAVTALPG